MPTPPPRVPHPSSPMHQPMPATHRPQPPARPMRETAPPDRPRGRPQAPRSAAPGPAAATRLLRRQPGSARPAFPAAGRQRARALQGPTRAPSRARPSSRQSGTQPWCRTAPSVAPSPAPRPTCRCRHRRRAPPDPLPNAAAKPAVHARKAGGDRIGRRLTVRGEVHPPHDAGNGGDVVTAQVGLSYTGSAGKNLRACARARQAPPLSDEGRRWPGQF